MPSATRRLAVAVTLTSTALAAAACGGGGSAGGPRHGSAAAAVRLVPQRIVHAPRNLRSIAQPQPGGTIWALAGGTSVGLFKISQATGHIEHSLSVSGAARSVAESAAGTLALALGSRSSGALQLISSRTTRTIKTVPLPAPARFVTAGSITRRSTC